MNRLGRVYQFLALFLAVTLAALTHAQTAPPAQTNQQQITQSWTPTGFVTLTATALSSSVVLGSAQLVPNDSFTAWVYNAGGAPANISLGGTAVIASTNSGTYVPIGVCVSLNATNATNLAAVTTTGTTSLIIMTGYGLPTQNCAGNTASVISGNLNIAPNPAGAPYGPQTVGTTDSIILPASTATSYLEIVNNSNVSAICVNFGAAATITAGLCPAGELTILPYWSKSWGLSDIIPVQAVHAISNTTGVPVTVGYK